MFAIIVYLIIVFIILAVISIISNLRNNGEIRRKIEEQWGKRSDKKYNKEEINDISGYFKNMRLYKKDSFFIDEITWNDLGMDEIFKDIDTTFSTPGEEVLYLILRKPIYNDENFKYRNKIIQYFIENPDKRENIQYILGKLGRKRGISITNYFYNDNSYEPRRSFLHMFRLFRLLPIVSIALIFVNVYLGIFCVITCCFINLAIHYFFKRKLDYKLRDFAYIINMVKCSNSILKAQVEELGQCVTKLKKATDSVKQIRKFYFNLFNDGTDVAMLVEYKNILFLTDLINYEKMSSILMRESDEFKTIHSVIGNIDSCIAIAAYRVRIKNYAIPKLHMCNNKQNQNIIIKEAVHPLIEKAIPNSLKIADSILITGSNASGKSTFLKTVALNIIFAQTICTCTASYFEGFYVKIYTSMALRDDVLSRESYYVVETKSLKRIIDNIDESLPTICFVDEILRGTNTVERIAASSQLLKYITLENCICVAATHDVELTYILENYFENYHFQENIVDNKILFDYKIYRGRSMTQNAIKLLSILGYKDDIVDRAQKKAEDFLKSGIWKVE
ncbi:MAG: DNA mismatch repair protein MutS [Clostridium sp.]|uniref:MutS-related protein n=1 Tax=Clostridium sp. TaxID=1506 RepID=UPI0025BBC0E2|nr:DNA mismatch repair protein MutS [Clostridium sp.]MCH3963372.1 DNA mismatch repair protein MutS [Clostridium sp.]MCI1716760.1 DNA mismatch repair protein MutS [Clostridium sp.]MCI1801056.1 DNA mismatch repair protein MutS [Clostridium sp.]MCI1814946.1 DNA mismatch repair protein MutS [Clostridium sp.]MCI1871847.1 DNA mismatch repair protein MutS [Clostridium sp.]